MVMKAPLLCAALLLGLALITLARNEVWRTDVSLWADATAKAPVNARAWGNYGIALEHAGRLDEAVEKLLISQDLDPSLMLVPVSLGNIALKQGRITDGFLQHRRALQLSARLPQAWVGIGVAWAMRGQLGMAETAFREAVKWGGDRSSGWQNLGYVLAKRGQWPQAVAAYRESLRWNPDFIPAQRGLVVAQRHLARGGG